MRTHPFQLFAFGHFCCSLVASPAFAKARIALKAKATDTFETFRTEIGDRPLTYVFAEGEFFGDSLRGNKIKKTAFREIAETLAEDFVTQNFLPTSDLKTADMLIVVHYGGVEINEDPMRLMALERAFEGIREQAEQGIAAGNAGTDPGESSPFDTYDAMDTRFDMLAHDTNLSSEAMQQARLANLLGFDEELKEERQKPFPSTLEERLMHDMYDERYLVIIMAWDQQAMIHRGEKRLLWLTRTSMKALGSNFDEAIKLMSGAAAPYYGQNSIGLETRTYKRQEYKIEMGEIEVVESGKAAEEEIKE